MRATPKRLKAVRDAIQFTASQLAAAYAAPDCYMEEKEEELRVAALELERVVRILDRMRGNT